MLFLKPFTGDTTTSTSELSAFPQPTSLRGRFQHRVQIEKAIADFLDADAYLLTTPMWNFSIPYAVKYYIDAIVQPGYLFRYDEDGLHNGSSREEG